MEAYFFLLVMRLIGEVLRCAYKSVISKGAMLGAKSASVLPKLLRLDQIPSRMPFSSGLFSFRDSLIIFFTNDITSWSSWASWSAAEFFSPFLPFGLSGFEEPFVGIGSFLDAEWDASVAVELGTRTVCDLFATALEGIELLIETGER